MNIAILTNTQKDLLVGVKYDGVQLFNPVQDRNYNWIISEEEIIGCTVTELSVWLDQLTLVEYSNYSDNDVDQITFNISSNVLKVTVFGAIGDYIVDLNINTLSAGRQTTLNALKTNILATTSDCTNIDFSRRGGVIKITSASSGVATSYFPDLSVGDKILYGDVGDICNELVIE